MSIDRGIDKEVVVHIHCGILLSPKKEHLWVSSNKVDEPRGYYTEWSKSERERQIPFINTNMWDLEIWYWWSYSQGSKGNTDIKNRLLDTVGEECGMIWENSTETYKQIASGSLIYDAGHQKPGFCDNLEGWGGEEGGRGVQEGRDTCMPMANS